MTNITTAEVLDKYSDKIAVAIQTLSDNLGIAADHFWPIFVKQQVIEGYVGISFFIIAIIGLFITCKLFIKTGGFDADDEPKNIINFLCVILFLFLLIVSSINLSPSIKEIINPEFYALQELTRMITQ